VRKCRVLKQVHNNSKVADCIGCIENNLICNTYDGALILGDFNLECDESSPGHRLTRDM